MAMATLANTIQEKLKNPLGSHADNEASSNEQSKPSNDSFALHHWTGHISQQQGDVTGGISYNHSLQDEKDFIAAYQERDTVLQPEEISRDPINKLLGSSSKQLSINDFELMRTVGTGTFARVWLSRFKNPREEDRNKVFALKVLRKADVINLKQVEHVRNERNTLAAVAGHPFITTLITSFSDDESLYMLLNYSPGGEIFSYLRRGQRFPERPHTVMYAAEIVLIIEYLHDVQGIAYRDLKPENILLDADGHLKLVDFGFAKQIHNRETYTLCGTPEYLAPEVIKNLGHTKAVDWWALGILIYEFLVGQPPFWDKNPLNIYEQIISGHVRFPSPQLHQIHVSNYAKDLIVQLCRVDPTERLGYVAGGARRVKQHPFFRDIDWDALYEKRAGKGPIIPKVEWAGDSGNFDEYPDPPAADKLEPYTDEMREQYEAAFADF